MASIAASTAAGLGVTGAASGIAAATQTAAAIGAAAGSFILPLAIVGAVAWGIFKLLEDD